MDKKSRDNRANQMNPNNPQYYKSRGKNPPGVKPRASSKNNQRGANTGAAYMWRVRAYKRRYGSFGDEILDSSLTKVFTNKIEAMQYAAEVERMNYDCFGSNNYIAHLDKWFGD